MQIRPQVQVASAEPYQNVRWLHQNRAITELEIGRGRDAIRNSKGSGGRLPLEDTVVLHVRHAVESAELRNSCRRQQSIVESKDNRIWLRLQADAACAGAGRVRRSSKNY
jgi:hypothetical protein